MQNDFRENLGCRIKELRNANNLTQESLAEKLNMERSNLARIEAGKQFPNVENLEKIIRVFNIEASCLFDFGHLKSKEELLNETIDIIKNLDYTKLQYVYKSLENLKNI